MNKIASHDHQWVWTEKTEKLRGIAYPESEVRKAGQPVPGWWQKSCPKTWVVKGYVEEALMGADDK